MTSCIIIIIEAMSFLRKINYHIWTLSENGNCLYHSVRGLTTGLRYRLNLVFINQLIQILVKQLQKL